MTPDGITTADWEPVHDLALAIVNAEDAGNAETHRLQLLVYLDELESRYGGLPSILATRADYVEDVNVREGLLRRAHEGALSRGDGRNALYVASSLARFYVEERPDRAEAFLWLSRARMHMSVAGADSDRRECDRIQHLLNEM